MAGQTILKLSEAEHSQLQQAITTISMLLARETASYAKASCTICEHYDADSGECELFNAKPPPEFLKANDCDQFIDCIPF